ncbi:hypothetical protein J2S37_000432 [Corynebacterium felinum]|uniref:Uncharacterized protein n=1 Tax=Corynebacterium felinum TaxID=131318 RepID=A0ABU2B778_9CORY|nr:hypothetical protein [Corynebacterium felinum]
MTRFRAYRRQHKTLATITVSEGFDVDKQFKRREP